VSGPALARSDELGRRFYTFGDPPESFWSVTTLISGGIPKFLGPHYAKMAAELAVDAFLERGPYSRPGATLRRLARLERAHILERQARGELKSLKPAKMSDREAALRWIKGAADRHRDAAAERGTAVHDEAEALVLAHAREASRLSLAGVEVAAWPAELAGYQEAFTRWVRDYRPEFLAAEATVFHRAQAYAGTLDAICRLHLPDGSSMVAIIDYKSGKAVYAEVALQLAAYARAEFIGAPDRVTELPLPQVDAGAVLHLRADGTYQFRLVRIDDAVFSAFLFGREVYRWLNETAKTVLLQDLTPDAPEPVLEVA
jgi:hypothetical protein